MQALAINIKGLKCDAPGCDYIDKTIQPEQYESYLNAPCPKCGASLLTPEDLAMVKLLMASADYVNSVVGPLPDDTPDVRIPIVFNGTGTIRLDLDHLKGAEDQT